MPITASPLSLMAAGLYGLVVIATGIGAGVAGRQRQKLWHRCSWLLLATLFILLSLSRMFEVEDLLRDYLREAFRSAGTYDNRREIQRPLVAIAIAAVGFGGFLWSYRIITTIKGRRDLAVTAALAGGFSMLFLSALRIISLHPIDALLYGPAKLNWLGDIGLSCVVAGAALYYTRVTLSSP